MKQAIQTAAAPAAIGPYSQGVISGDIFYSSGQVPIDPGSGKLVGDNLEEQAHLVMKNLSAVLAAAGCNWDSVLKTTIFLTDLGDFQVVNEIYAGYLSEPFPARSTIQVAALPLGARIEIEVIATITG